MTAPFDLTGKRCGALTPISRDGIFWHCECLCGGTRRIRGTYLLRAVSHGWSPSCGKCRKPGRPHKYATLYKGELRGMREISQMTGISIRRLDQWCADGQISEARIDARVERSRRNAIAKRLGLGADLLSARRLCWGDVEKVYTTPKDEIKASAGRRSAA